MRHPAVGEIDLTFEAFDILADAGLTLLVYTAQPGSTHEDALSLLASWAATQARIGDPATEWIASNPS